MFARGGGLRLSRFSAQAAAELQSLDDDTQHRCSQPRADAAPCTSTSMCHAYYIIERRIMSSNSYYVPWYMTCSILVVETAPGSFTF
mmetsp:Transcript_11665/g.24035  ORF Transcript_11665/g.24035 Transcript_11665/m.24035 type:complete len:87 (+) Transcript_11665:229-489(+)